MPRAAALQRAAALVLLVLAGACGDDGTGPGLPPRIAITPEVPVSLYIGDSITVTATVRNLTHTGVSYLSTAPEVATVDAATGLVTAIAPGQATVHGISAVDPRVNAQVEVTVHADLPASITLVGLAGADGAELDRSAVAGEVTVTLSAETGNAQRVEVRVGEVVVCVEPLQPPPPGAGASSGAVEVECAVDTGGYEPTDGTPSFANGDHPLEARLVAAGERVIAATDPATLTLRNQSRIAGTVAGARSAVDAAGATWIGGELTVRAVPVLYEADVDVTSVTFTYRTPAGRDTAATDATAPYELALPPTGVLAGVHDPALRISLTSSTTDGEEGPTGGTAAVRYDAAPPVPGSLTPREWVGAQTRFVDSYSAEGEKDDGVGRVHLKFFAGDPALTPAAIVASGNAVTVGADLPQAGAESYRLAARVCDGLDNCTLLEGYRFGVDLTPPIVEAVSLEDRARNPGADMLLDIRDDLSGFSDNPLEAAVRLLDASPATAACGPAVEGLDLPGRSVAGMCAPDTVPNPLPVPRTTAGYYSYSIVAFDQAGNRSPVVERTLLVDLQPPVVGGLQVPTPLEPGANVTLRATASDDVEVAEVEFALVYPMASGGGTIAVPFAPPTPAGAPFDETLTREFAASGAVPAVRTLTFGAAAPGARSTVLLDSVRATARDAAGLAASTRRDLTPADYGGDASTADPFPRFDTAALSVDRVSVCSGGCGAGDPQAVRITARVEGEGGTGIPFARIHFYRRDAGGQLVHIASRPGGEATITNAGGRSSYVYVLDHQPPPLLVGEFGIVAIGVNSRGNALATPVAAAPRVTFYRR